MPSLITATFIVEILFTSAFKWIFFFQYSTTIVIRFFFFVSLSGFCFRQYLVDGDCIWDLHCKWKREEIFEFGWKFLILIQTSGCNWANFAICMGIRCFNQNSKFPSLFANPRCNYHPTEHILSFEDFFFFC